MSPPYYPLLPCLALLTVCWISLDGGSGNGKSQLMFQLVAHATQSDYVVMYIPKGTQQQDPCLWFRD